MAELATQNPANRSWVRIRRLKPGVTSPSHAQGGEAKAACNTSYARQGLYVQRQMAAKCRVGMSSAGPVSLATFGTGVVLAAGQVGSVCVKCRTGVVHAVQRANKG